jgi:hypothetical protein
MCKGVSFTSLSFPAKSRSQKARHVCARRAYNHQGGGEEVHRSALAVRCGLLLGLLGPYAGG